MTTNCFVSPGFMDTKSLSAVYFESNPTTAAAGSAMAKNVNAMEIAAANVATVLAIRNCVSFPEWWCVKGSRRMSCERSSLDRQCECFGQLTSSFHEFRFVAMLESGVENGEKRTAGMAAAPREF